MIPYLFYHLVDEYISKNKIDLLRSVLDLHIYQTSYKKIIINHDSCFIYCFNLEQYQSCIEQGHTPHICFNGDDLLTSPLRDVITENHEVFWFPSVNNINNDMSLYISSLEKLNHAVCISLSEIFNPETINEKSRMWLEKLHEQFSNPLLHKEENMLSDEVFNQENIYIFQNNDECIEKPLVLGIFGDANISSLPIFLKYNTTTILKTPICNNCQFQDYCIDRGLGYIMHKYDYKGCIGIKLLLRT